MFEIIIIVAVECILYFVIMPKLEAKSILLARIIEIIGICAIAIIVFPNSVFAYSGSIYDNRVKWENLPVFLLQSYAMYFMFPYLRHNDEDRDSYTRLIICTIILCFCMAYWIKN